MLSFLGRLDTMLTMNESAVLHSKRMFFLKRLMSILGLFPLGIYVVLHLWTNLASLGGPTTYNHALLASRSHPTFLALEVLLALAFLAHIVIGIIIVIKWRPNNLRVRKFSNLKFMLQRITGMGILLFLVVHVYNARISPAMKQAGGMENWHGMRKALHEPLTLIVYILALLGVSFHLANGFWTFLLTWGVTVTPKAQKIAQAISAILLVTLLAMSAVTIYGFLQPHPPV